jgi:hypothetical protein
LPLYSNTVTLNRGQGDLDAAGHSRNLAPTVFAGGYLGLILGTSGLQSLWLLNDPSGNALDSKGGIAGTVNAAITRSVTGIIPGETLTAMSFTGNAGVNVTFGDNYDFPNRAAFSSEVWFKLNAGLTGTRTLFSKRLAGTGGWEIQATNGPAITGVRGDAASFDFCSDPASLGAQVPALGDTYHVLFTYDGTTMILYVNGVAGTSAASTRNLPDHATALTLGTDLAGNNGVNTIIQAAAIYNVALTAQQAQDHFAGVSSASNFRVTALADNPDGYYRLGEAAGATVAATAVGTITGTYPPTPNKPTLGAPSALANDPNTAATFDGDQLGVVGDYVDLGDNFRRTGTSVFGVEAIVNPTDNTGTRMIASAIPATVAGLPLTITGTPTQGASVVTINDTGFDRVQVPTAQTDLDETQGWWAGKVVMGWASAGALPNNAPGFGAWADAAFTNRIVAYFGSGASTFALLRDSGGVAQQASVTGSWTLAETILIVAHWTATTLNVSLKGAAFTTAASTSIPTLAATNFDIGSLSTVGTLRTIMGDVVWFAAGTGVLTNTDLTTMNALGGDIVFGTLPGAANMKMRWTCADFNYERAGVGVGAGGWRFGAGAQFFASREDIGGARDTVTAPALPMNVETVVAAGYDGTNLKLYRNGVEVGTVASSRSIPTQVVAAKIGNTPDLLTTWKGKIDEVSLYDSAPSSTRWLAHATAANAPADPTTIAFTAPAAAASVSGMTVVTGTNAANAVLVEVKVDSDPYRVAVIRANGQSWSSNWDMQTLTPGTHTFTARSTTALGAQATATRDLVVSANGTIPGLLLDRFNNWSTATNTNKYAVVNGSINTMDQMNTGIAAGKVGLYRDMKSVQTGWIQSIDITEARNNGWLCHTKSSGGTAEYINNASDFNSRLIRMDLPAVWARWVSQTLSYYTARPWLNAILIDNSHPAAIYHPNPQQGINDPDFYPFELPDYTTWRAAFAAMYKYCCQALLDAGIFVQLNITQNMYNLPGGPPFPGSSWSQTYADADWWREISKYCHVANWERQMAANGLMQVWSGPYPGEWDAARAWQPFVNSLGIDFMTGGAFAKQGGSATADIQGVIYGRASLLLDWNGRGGYIKQADLENTGDPWPSNPSWHDDVGQPLAPAENVAPHVYGRQFTLRKVLVNSNSYGSANQAFTWLGTSYNMPSPSALIV